MPRRVSVYGLCGGGVGVVWLCGCGLLGEIAVSVEHHTVSADIQVNDLPAYYGRTL